ncbi:VOC family protein [Nocardia inohanensis]|uniref:VOC family protein n=1 Tax=Nocardia inohanensis TaxID=209246 RepID=UPI0008321850|nr:VOC family protein [Nocardia inohanensis]
MYGMPAWFDLTTAEPAKAIEFYMQLFDWSAEPVVMTDYGKYIMFRRNGAPVAGLVERTGATPQPDGWLTYLSTADISATIAAAQANRGGVQRPILEIPGIGTTAVLTDPAGSAIGVVRPDGDAEERAAGPTAPVWTELESVDWPLTFDFATEVFALRTEIQSATPGSRFATFHDENHPRGGIFELAPEIPHSRWEVAFLVDDAQQAVDRAVELGGTIVRPVYDIPVGTGLGARVADPSGAHFNFIAF